MNGWFISINEAIQPRKVAEIGILNFTRSSGKSCIKHVFFQLISSESDQILQAVFYFLKGTSCKKPPLKPHKKTRRRKERRDFESGLCEWDDSNFYIIFTLVTLPMFSFHRCCP